MAALNILVVLNAACPGSVVGAISGLPHARGRGAEITNQAGPRNDLAKAAFTRASAQNSQSSTGRTLMATPGGPWQPVRSLGGTDSASEAKAALAGRGDLRSSSRASCRQRNKCEKGRPSQGATDSNEALMLSTSARTAGSTSRAHKRSVLAATISSEVGGRYIGGYRSSQDLCIQT